MRCVSSGVAGSLAGRELRKKKRAVLTMDHGVPACSGQFTDVVTRHRAPLVKKAPTGHGSFYIYVFGPPKKYSLTAPFLGRTIPAVTERCTPQAIWRSFPTKMRRAPPGRVAP